MKQAQPANTSTEQRRKLLKGMLAASSVVGLGYSASASAITSLTQCIQNQTLPETTQFACGETPPSGSKVAWKEVTVRWYRGANGRGKAGFLLPNDNKVYMDESPWSVIPSPVSQDKPGYPKKAWVVVYFDSDTHAEIGAFPQYQHPTTVGGVGRAQASLNCLNSLKLGLANDYKFGG